MKKSELYQMAMRCVLNAGYSADATIEIIAQLLEDQKSARWNEEREEQS